MSIPILEHSLYSEGIGYTQSRIVGDRAVSVIPQSFDVFAQNWQDAVNNVYVTCFFIGPVHDNPKFYRRLVFACLAAGATKVDVNLYKHKSNVTRFFDISDRFIYLETLSFRARADCSLGVIENAA